MSSGILIDADAYALKYIPETSSINHVIVTDRMLRIEGSPNLGTDKFLAALDRMVFLHLSMSFDDNIFVGHRPHPPETTVGFPGKGAVRYRTFSPGTIYVTAVLQKAISHSGEMAEFGIPELHLTGSAKDIGDMGVRLSAIAPGDAPCLEACHSPGEAFSAVKGRLQALINRIQKGNQ